MSRVVGREAGAHLNGDRSNRDIQIIDDPASRNESRFEDTELPSGRLIPVDPTNDLTKPAVLALQQSPALGLGAEPGKTKRDLRRYR